MRRYIKLVLIVGLLVLWGFNQLEAKVVKGEEVQAFLTEELAGWRLKEGVRVFDRHNIFDYMNGAGEFYLAYSFIDLRVGVYVKADNDPVTVEIYCLANSEDAFGVYNHDLDGSSLDIGQGVIYGRGFLKGWKNNIFIRIVAMEETPAIKTFIQSTAKHIFGQIKEVGPKPRLIERLPTPGMLADSLRFFHTNNSLNNLYFLASVNILKLSEKTNVVTAQYKPDGEKKVRLFIVEYPDSEAAESAYQSFKKVYLPEVAESRSSEVIQEIEAGQLVGAKLITTYVYLIFEAGESKFIKEVFTKAETDYK